MKMCTGLVQKAKVSGAGKSPDGWFKVEDLSVLYDCTYHMQSPQGINIEFFNEKEGPGARVAVELNPRSAMDLVHAIMESLYSAGIDPGEAALGLEVAAVPNVAERKRASAEAPAIGASCAQAAT